MPVSPRKIALALLAIIVVSVAVTAYLMKAPPPPPPTFAITQVQYTDANGKVQTTMFAKQSAQIRAISVKNEIVIGGTFTTNSTPAPDFAVIVHVSGGGDATSSGAPIISGNNWTYTIPPNTLPTNTGCSISITIDGGPNDKVTVGKQTLIISAN